MYRLMLVDDEPFITNTLKAQLSNMGYTVAGIARTGEDAVAQAKRHLPDLILMDIKMPGELDGIGAAETIRKELDIPVVFMTAHSDRELIDRAKSFGPFGYVIKTFHEGQLRAAIEVAISNDGMEKRLRESENRYRTLVETSPYGIQELDPHGYIIFCNAQSSRIFGVDHEKMIGMPFRNLVISEKREGVFEDIFKSNIDAVPDPIPWSGKICTEKDEIKHIQIDWNYKKDKKGRINGCIAIVSDITERIRVQDMLKKTRDELEKRVKERTRELMLANEMLNTEISERCLKEQALKEKEQELRIQTLSLEEANAALKVLLKRRDRDRVEMEEKILMNVKELIMPFVEKLKNSHLDAQQVACMNILESNLNEIVSPFVRALSSKYFSLTPMEIQVANLIKQGSTSKQIAGLLGTTVRAVEFHRNNLRKKLHINNKKINLRTFLITLP